MELTPERQAQLRAGLQQAIEAGDRQAGVALGQQALAEGVGVEDFFLRVIQPVLYDIGERFARLEVFLPELMKAGMVVKAIHLQVLEPAMRQTQSQASLSAGVVVLGTCQGDIHDIGKNMVLLMLQVNGFQVTDLGTNVAPRAFIEAARAHNADIIGLSSLLTPSMPYMRDVLNLLQGYGLRERFLVVVGGAPITEQYAQSIGADAYGLDAVRAVETCRALMARKRGAGKEAA